MVFKCLTHAHTILIGLVLSLREKEEKQETRALIHLQRRQWQHTLVFSPGKSRGRRSLVGCSPWGREESDTTSLSLSLFTFMHWRRRWQPTLVFLPGESQGQGSLVGCRLWGRTESDMTEETYHHQQHPLGWQILGHSGQWSLWNMPESNPDQSSSVASMATCLFTEGLRKK